MARDSWLGLHCHLLFQPASENSEASEGVRTGEAVHVGVLGADREANAPELSRSAEVVHGPARRPLLSVRGIEA
jgi:hypothetical protein